jgi:hypothetical protein
MKERLAQYIFEAAVVVMFIVAIGYALWRGQ